MLPGNPMFPIELFLSCLPKRQFLECYFLSAPSTSAPPCLCGLPLCLLHRKKRASKKTLSFLLTKYRLTYFHPTSYFSLSYYFFLLHFLLPPSHSHTLSPKRSASLVILPIFYFSCSLDLHLFLCHFLISEFIHGSILAV